MQDTLVQLLGGEHPLEKGQATYSSFLGLPFGSAGKESTCNVGDLGSIPGLRRSSREWKGYWPRECHGLYNPWGHKESDTTERLSLHFTSLTNNSVHINLTAEMRWTNSFKSTNYYKAPNMVQII